jgi:hypothetical protein
MKIGDRVKNDFWHLEGIVQDIRPCQSLMCGEQSLTLDPKGSSVISYYHARRFVVVEKEAK